MNWLAETKAIVAKEWRCELRTRSALSTVGLFGFTTLVVVSMSLGPIGSSPEMLPVLPVLMWLILLFAASAGLPRTFVHEEETRSADALRLAARPSSLFCGKALYNLSLIFALELIIAPLFVAMLGVPVEQPWWFAASLLGGAIGLGIGSTLIAAMVAQAQVRGALFAVLAFPILLPLLKLSIDASYGAIVGQPADVALTLAFLYDSMLMIAGLMLFPSIWNP